MRCAGLLLVLVLVAGCLGDGGREPVGTVGPTPTTSGTASTTTTPPLPGPPVVDLLLGFAFEDCRGVSVQQTVPIAEVQALLPAGFTAQPSGFGDGLGTVVIDLYACGNLTASAARVPSTYYGQLYTLIDPPTERVPGTPEAAFHEYVFRVLAGEDVLAALWPAAGYDTRSGAAAVRVGPPNDAVPLDLGARTADASVGDGYRLSAAGSTLRVNPVTGAFARYTALNDGSVLVWTGLYDFGAAYGGQGSFQVPDDDLFDRFEVADITGGGLAILYEGGGMSAMDLRRVFTPP